MYQVTHHHLVCFAASSEAAGGVRVALHAAAKGTWSLLGQLEEAVTSHCALTSGALEDSGIVGGTIVDESPLDVKTLA